MLNDTMRRAFIILLLLALACIPASATLSPMGFGFPAMSQFAQNTAFSKGFTKAFDFETASISPFGSMGCGFPAVAQSSVEGQVVNEMEFSQSTLVSAFSFPAVDTGLGFAGFGDFVGLGDTGFLF